jgi:hypothetical protein
MGAVVAPNAPNRNFAMPHVANPLSSVKLPAALVQSAPEAIARYDARQRGGALDESLDAIESRFVDAETSSRLVQAVRSTVSANRQKADTALQRAG